MLAVASAGPARSEDPPAASEAAKVAFHGRVLLSDLEPVDDRENRKAELFYAAVSADFTMHGWGAHVEARGAEGRFRAYFPGSVWLEEGYGFRDTALGQVRVGKLGRAFGRPDETFGGNVFSRNGVSRNPDLGAGLSGEKRLGWDELRWDLRYFGQNDHVAWEEDGRGVESDPAASLKGDVELHVAYAWRPSLLSVVPEISLATARIARDGAVPDVRRKDVAAGLTLTIGPPLAVVLQGFWRSGESAEPGSRDARLGYDDADATLVEVRSEFPNVTYRYVYSEWRYHGADSSERMHQPEVEWSPVKCLRALVGYEARRFRSPVGVTTSNAFRFGLTLSF